MTDGGASQRSISRADLHRLVWSKPMIHVASEFGISGNGLAKVCRKLDVPYPPRGYWAKHAVGKAPPAAPLPPRKNSTPEATTITASPAPSLEQSIMTKAQKDREAALERIGAIDVPDRLTRPHPVIAGWIDERKRQRQEAKLHRDPWRRDLSRVADFTEADRRRHRILNVLFRALEKEGGKIIQTDRRELRWEKDGESVEFQLRDKLRQVRRPLNDREKQWASASDKGWRQELEPTGKLIFEFKTYLREGLRRDWLETEAKPMEAMLPEIAATFVAAIPQLVEVRHEREETERRWREAEQRRQEQEQRRKLDEARWRRFVELAQSAREVEIAREFLARLKAGEPKLSEQAGADTVGDWIEWAEERIAARDPLARRPAEIFDEIARVSAWAYRD